ncbi:aconitate hydratase [Desulfatitalea tepidiphila]|uniref:aconitate hydratase n=1 Tax=Desulfatitalea tepidiphila TaxID=1185843 RepID=UPI0006B4AA17|nr:aconitate hydratase [Desulfatitalea tepidiphila]
MAMNVTQKLIVSHLVNGRMRPGEEIGLRIDQTLTQDATGTMVMLEFEAMQVGRVKTELSAQYVDHNLLQTDYRNADDHLFLRSACQKFGIWYSRPGNGVSHPVHMQRFGIPGKTLIGSDSHTPAAGALGMLAFGAGGLEVATVMAGEPMYVRMPEVLGIRLTGRLPDWVSAKDVILEMLRRYGVDGGRGKIIEYFGPGLDDLSAMDRHVIANMGTELGATTTVFPSDDAVRRFLDTQQRGEVWREVKADADAGYDQTDHIDLGTLEPLIALPSSPGNVVPVREVIGRPIYQAYIGSSANPGLRDFAVPALMVAGRRIPDHISFDVNPTSRQLIENMIELGLMAHLINCGARFHQAGCNGCIGMGQAPATGKISLRTVPRNFPGRSGTIEDQVYLCSPETATASALNGVITDPRTLSMPYPRFKEPERLSVNTTLLLGPLENSEGVELEKGPNIKPLPEFDALPDRIEGPVLLKMGDNISTDEIMPAGASVLPFRSNIPEISRFAFSRIDLDYYDRTIRYQKTGSFVIGGDNYGQGSSREHAALAPRYLGLRAVIAKSFARIHAQNLINFGIVPLTFENGDDWRRVEQGDQLRMTGLVARLKAGEPFDIENLTRNWAFRVGFALSQRQLEVLLAGGLINHIRHIRQTAGNTAP